MLHGEHIILRPVREADLDAMHAAHVEIRNRGAFFRSVWSPSPPFDDRGRVRAVLPAVRRAFRRAGLDHRGGAADRRLPVRDEEAPSHPPGDRPGECRLAANRREVRLERPTTTAFVANGLGFPDALAGGPAGGAYGGPLLLVNTLGVPTPTQQQLQRLQPARIFVLGGTAVVPDSVITQINGLFP